MVGRRLASGLSAILLAACGAGGGTGGLPTDYEALCAGYTAPAAASADGCAEVDPADPTALVDCPRGSGGAGRWAIDAAGLPVYDLRVEHRCDPAGHVTTPVRGERLAPVHLIGNGRGTLAVAHASGAVELLSHERGAVSLTGVDLWRDPDDDPYPAQLGGALLYLEVDGRLVSTRWDDMAPGEAAARQTRRFGPGYVETVTEVEDLRVTRRVFAPDLEARALVVETTIDNLADRNREVGLIEAWDVNIHQATPEPDADLSDRVTWQAVRGRRRALMESFRHELSYDAADRVMLVETVAEPPAGVTDRLDVSDADWFVDPIFMAPIDAAEPPDVVWLAADGRPPHELFADDAPGFASRTEAAAGAGQPVFLAMRRTVRVPVAAPVVRRHAFGYAPAGRVALDDVDALRAAHGELAAAAAEAWRRRLVWLAVPGADRAAAIQREVAWSSYALQAGAYHDEYTGLRLVGAGGAARHLRGLEAAPADLALVAEALLLVDPVLARGTLAFAMAGQRGRTGEPPWQLPHASGGVGAALHDGGPARRSDSYLFVPAAVARYLALTRDGDFLDRAVPFWPRAAGEKETVLAHLRGAVAFAEEELGTGGRGLLALGASDAGDDPLAGALEPAAGASSVRNAAAAAAGFPLLADAIEARDPALADRLRAVADEQAALLLAGGRTGVVFERGFTAAGAPLLPGALFLEPQVLAILAGLVDPAEAAALLELVAEHLETPAGALDAAWLDRDGAPGAVRPLAAAWLTEVRAAADPAGGWTSLWRGSMAAHAEAFPGLWTGIWTGPRAWQGAGGARPGAADVRVDPALAAWPALSSLPHAGMLRAVMSVIGVSGGAGVLRIDPRVPGETFAVRAPRLELTGAPDALAGSFTPSGSGLVRAEVTLPGGLREGQIQVTVNGATVIPAREGDRVSFDLPLEQGTATVWSITR